MENKDFSIIDNALLSKYVQGMCSADEISMVENAMRSDEFLKDAVEGLKQGSGTAAIDDSIAALNYSIGTRSGFIASKARPIINISSISLKIVLPIAASIIIVAGTYLIAHSLLKSPNQFAQDKEAVHVNTTEQKQSTTTTISEPSAEEKSLEDLSIKNIEQTTTESKPTAPTSTPIATNQSAIKPNSVEMSTGAAPSTYNWTLPTTSSDKTTDVTTKNRISGQVLDRKTQKPLAGVNIVSGNLSTMTSQNGYYEIALDDQQKEIEFSQPGYQDEAKIIDTKGDKIVNVQLEQGFVVDGLSKNKKDADLGVANASATKKSSSDDLKNGLDLYTNQEYSKAINSFDKVLSTNPSSQEANYYNGLSHSNINKSSKAISYFNKVIKANGKYAEDAKWQKAQILLKQNNYAEAKPILQELKNSAKYKVQADGILDSKK